MIDKRLLKEMPETKKYVVRQVAMQWISLLCNIGFVMLIAWILVALFDNVMQIQQLWFMVGGSIVLLLIRMYCTKKASNYAHLASSQVKDHLRKRLYEKILSMKNAYQDYISTSELVHLNVEGIDQLETYFGRYLPQFFYSMLAPITLCLVLVWMDVQSSLVLLVCVPLIPLSIIAIQKFAKKLLSKYWKSYVTQDTVLFQDTIFNNVHIANLQASVIDVEKACKQANIHEFIMSLPKDYATSVSELGDSLSGGEKQRIALARAFLHNANCILLDEPTSNLDALNEAMILRSLQQQKDKTIVFVSHRPGTLKIVNRILSLENGRGC